MTNKLKGFWPVPEGGKELCKYSVEILSMIKNDEPSEEKLSKWLVRRYSLKYYASAD